MGKFIFKLLKKRFLKLNKDKFVKQILTHPYSTFVTIGWHYANKHPKMSKNILNIKLYKCFYLA